MIKKSSIITFFMMFFFLFLFWNIDNAFAEEIGRNIVAQIVNKFKEQSSSWYDPVKNAATYLFSLVLFYELAWSSIKAALQQMSMQDYFINFVLIILSGCFFLAVINNYQEWSNAIVNGLTNIVNEHLGTGYRIDDPFDVALKLFEEMIKITEGMKGLEYVGTLIACFFCGIIIMIIFALITAKMVVIHCEVLIGMLGCLLLISFGASQTFKEFAINSMKHILSIGFKLFMMNLIIAISFTFIKDFTFSEDGLLLECLILVGFSIVLLCICFELPGTIASLVSSAHGTSGNMLMALNTVMNTITAGAVAAKTSIKTASAPAIGIGKSIMQGMAAKKLAYESMLGKDDNDKYTDSSKWDGMTKYGKSKATFGVWNEARKQANANHSTIYREIKNNQLALRQLREGV